MEMHVFLLMLLVCSLFTSLTVEAIKKMLEGKNKKSNLIAAAVAIVLAAAIGVGYAILFGAINMTQYIVAIVALCFLSWLCAMVGYDKVIQAIKQLSKASSEV